MTDARRATVTGRTPDTSVIRASTTFDTALPNQSADESAEALRSGSTATLIAAISGVAGGVERQSHRPAAATNAATAAATTPAMIHEPRRAGAVPLVSACRNSSALW